MTFQVAENLGHAAISCKSDIFLELMFLNLQTKVPIAPAWESMGAHSKQTAGNLSAAE